VSGGPPAAVLRVIRTLGLRECATCGYAAGGDPVMVAALYSVMIERPGLNEYLCRCPERRP
jgi:hypothetical protein